MLSDAATGGAARTQGPRVFFFAGARPDQHLPAS
jgi:hypothetical protein